MYKCTALIKPIIELIMFVGRTGQAPLPSVFPMLPSAALLLQVLIVLVESISYFASLYFIPVEQNPEDGW